MGLHIHFSGGSSPWFLMSRPSRLHMYELLQGSVGHASANRAFYPSFLLPVLYVLPVAQSWINNWNWPEKKTGQTEWLELFAFFSSFHV